MKFLSVLLLALILPACTVPGKKLLSLEVQQSGAVLLSTSFDVPDTSSGAGMWDRAGEPPFSTEVDSVTPSTSDPLKAEVTGEVELRILWTGNVETQATLRDLQLMRSATGSNDWHLPADEVRRAKAAAGL